MSSAVPITPAALSTFVFTPSTPSVTTSAVPIRPIPFDFSPKRLSPNSDVYPPFDIPHRALDVALRSSDQVYFHGLKMLLSIASPLFRDIFTLPQPTPTIIAQTASGISSMDETRLGRPVIAVTESSVVLQRLLELCYPKWAPESDILQLGEIQEVLEAAHKYQMTQVLQTLGNTLTTQRFLDQDPFRVFAVACRYHLKTQVAAAARHTLRSPLSSRFYIPDLKYISAAVLQRLLDYHFKCVGAAQRVATAKEGKFPWITRDDYQWFRHQCVPCSAMGESVIISSNRVQSAAGYWVRYMDDVWKGLAETPCVAVVMKQDLMDKAVKLAHACPACVGDEKLKVIEDFQAFRILLAKEVERVLSTVSASQFE